MPPIFKPSIKITNDGELLDAISTLLNLHNKDDYIENALTIFNWKGTSVPGVSSYAEAERLHQLEKESKNEL